MPDNTNTPAHQSQESASKPSSPVPGAAPAGASGVQAGAGRTHPDVDVAQNAKAVGGGLEAGSSDFGPDTTSKVGGNTSAGGGTARSTASTTTDTAAQSAPAAAGGNSVLNTGRPTQGDTRSAIGAAAVPTKANPDVEDPSGYAVGQSTRQASDPSGVGTLGGGTAGTPATKPDQRTTDMTEGKVGQTEGTLPGSEDLNFKGAAEGTPKTKRDVARGETPSGNP